MQTVQFLFKDKLIAEITCDVLEMKREIQPYLLDDVDSNPDEDFLGEHILGRRRPKADVV